MSGVRFINLGLNLPQTFMTRMIARGMTELDTEMTETFQRVSSAWTTIVRLLTVESDSWETVCRHLNGFLNNGSTGLEDLERVATELEAAAAASTTTVSV